LMVYHSRTTPQRDGGSLVILRYCGRNVVIDGNNRVNLWRAQKKPGPFHAIVIEPNENAAYLFFQRRIYTIVAVGGVLSFLDFNLGPRP